MQHRFALRPRSILARLAAPAVCLALLPLAAVGASPGTPFTSPGASFASTQRTPMSADAPGAADLERVFAGLEERIRRVEFDNGLRLIMMKQDYSPTVACYMKFRAGSADETDASSGIAHMLEHMLFKGTPRVGTRNYEREEKYIWLSVRFAERLDQWRRTAREARAENDEATYELASAEVLKWRRRLAQIHALQRRYTLEEEDSYLYSRHGARGYNAYTSADLTNYQVNLPKNRLEVWARLESDRMRNSVLRNFYTERNVVAEERRMRVDNDARRALLEAFQIEVYNGTAHPYGRPVIGPMSSIQFLNYDQAMDFYDTYYAPNNAVIALVGDIDFEQTEALVRRYFGDMQPRSIPAPPEAETPEPRAVNVRVRKAGSPVLYLAWYKPSLPDPDDLYLDALGDILTDGQDSRLYQRLVVEERLAASVGAWTGYPGERYTNLFLINVTPAPGADYDAIRAAVLDEIESIRKEGVRNDEIARVRNNLRASFIYELRSNANLADALSYYEILTGSYKTMFEYNALLDELNAEKVQGAVQRHLRPDVVMDARLLPPEDGASSSGDADASRDPEDS